jgi:DNA replication protein
MLKHLIQKGYVNVNKLFLENYNNFGLNEVECVVLLKLFEMLKHNQVTITVSGLAKKTSMSVNECSNVLNGLFNRGLVSLDLETTKQGKTKESFNLDECIKYIENFFYNEMRNKEINDNQDEIKQIIEMLEDTFKRQLTPLELQVIVEWSQAGETVNSIKKAVALAVGAKTLNIKYIDSCLRALKSKQNEDEVVLSDEQSKILNDFYRKLK